MNDKIKNYILSNWDKYNVVDSREKMLSLLNVLEAHNENLDTLHDIVMGNTDMLAGIWITSNPQTDREVVKILYEYNYFFKTEEELHSYIRNIAEECDLTFEECLESEDVVKTQDGYVVILHY